MSSVTNPPSVFAPPRRVPTLDELHEMTSEPDQRVVIRGVQLGVLRTARHTRSRRGPTSMWITTGRTSRSWS